MFLASSNIQVALDALKAEATTHHPCLAVCSAVDIIQMSIYGIQDNLVSFRLAYRAHFQKSLKGLLPTDIFHEIKALLHKTAPVSSAVAPAAAAAATILLLPTTDQNRSFQTSNPPAHLKNLYSRDHEAYREETAVLLLQGFGAVTRLEQQRHH